MDLVVQLVKALAWPTITVFFALLFRRDIGRAINRTSKLKYKDFELSLTEAEAKVIAISETVLPKLPIVVEDETLERLRRIADESPSLAIVEAYKMVEDAAAKSGFIQGSHVPRVNTPLYIDWVIRMNKLRPEDQELVRTLRNLRNQAVHATLTEPELVLTKSEVERYLQLAAQVSKIILRSHE